MPASTSSEGTAIAVPPEAAAKHEMAANQHQAHQKPVRSAEMATLKQTLKGLVLITGRISSPSGSGAFVTDSSATYDSCIMDLLANLLGKLRFPLGLFQSDDYNGRQFRGK